MTSQPPAAGPRPTQPIPVAQPNPTLSLPTVELPPRALKQQAHSWPLVVSLAATCVVAVLLVGVGVLWSTVLAPHDHAAEVGQSTRPSATAAAEPPFQGGKLPGPGPAQTGRPTPDEKTSRGPDLPPLFSARPGEPSIGDPIG